MICFATKVNETAETSVKRVPVSLDQIGPQINGWGSVLQLLEAQYRPRDCDFTPINGTLIKA